MTSQNWWLDTLMEYSQRTPHECPKVAFQTKVQHTGNTVAIIKIGVWYMI